MKGCSLYVPGICPESCDTLKSGKKIGGCLYPFEYGKCNGIRGCAYRKFDDTKEDCRQCVVDSYEEVQRAIRYALTRHNDAYCKEQTTRGFSKALDWRTLCFEYKKANGKETKSFNKVLDWAKTCGKFYVTKEGTIHNTSLRTDNET